MKNIIYPILLSLFLLSFQSQAELLSEEQYQQIKKVFFEKDKEKRELVVFDLNNHKNISEDERVEISKISKYDNSASVIANYILKGEGKNHFSVLHGSDGVSSWLYPKGLEPRSFIENECSYLFYVSTNNDCLNTPMPIKKNITEFLKKHNVKIDEEYFADFIFIHELSHLLPSQKKLPEGVDVTRIWVDKTIEQYREVYSDLFSILFLHNQMKYPEYKINEVIQFRKFNLNANDDLRHYSIPYIEKMKQFEEWTEVKTFEEMDSLIKKIYLEVNEETIISIKSYPVVHARNFYWCDNLDFSSVQTKEALDILVYHCKKLKK